jgi:intracellular multiplication protein IcmK
LIQALFKAKKSSRPAYFTSFTLLCGLGLCFVLSAMHSVNVFAQNVARPGPLPAPMHQLPPPPPAGFGQPRPMSVAPTDNVAPPRSGLGQTVNVISTPKATTPVPVQKKVARIFSEFERTQMTPKQLKHVKKMSLDQQEVLSSPYNNTPKPVTRTLMLNLSPGVSAPILRLSAGALTSVVFSSNNGDPWYIEQVKLNRNFFSDGMAASGGAGGGADAAPTNVLTLEPLRSVAQGNVSIMLKGLSTPVIFSLSTGQPEVDFRVDAKVPGRNPDSTTQISYEERLPSLDDNVPYFLDGVPPKGAKRLKVTGGGSGNGGNGDVEAWRLNGNMYIRTNAEVQYPAYHSSARSTSGLAVYRFNQAYHAVTLLQSGRAYTVQIEGQD